MEKSISIRKSSEFSVGSSVCLYLNDQKILFNGYSYRELKIRSEDVVRARHLWLKSKKIGIRKFGDNAKYEIIHLLGRKFGFIFIVITSLCLILFLITNIWWLGLPIGLMGVYIFITLSLLSNRYLKIVQT